MGFIFGGGKSKTTTPAAVSGLQLQSSTQGLPLQLVFGTTKIAPNLIQYDDFIATAQQSSAGSGGKGGGGGGGGKGGGGTSGYIYQTAVALGLCAGQIQGVGAVYVDKTITSLSSLGLSLFTGSYSQNPWGYLAATYGGQVTESYTIPSSPYKITVSQAASFVSDYGVNGATVSTPYTSVGGTNQSVGIFV